MTTAKMFLAILLVVSGLLSKNAAYAQTYLAARGTGQVLVGDRTLVTLQEGIDYRVIGLSPNEGVYIATASGTADLRDPKQFQLLPGGVFASDATVILSDVEATTGLHAGAVRSEGGNGRLPTFGGDPTWKASYTARMIPSKAMAHVYAVFQWFVNDEPVAIDIQRIGTVAANRPTDLSFSVPIRLSQKSGTYAIHIYAGYTEIGQTGGNKATPAPRAMTGASTAGIPGLPPEPSKSTSSDVYIPGLLGNDNSTDAGIPGLPLSSKSPRNDASIPGLPSGDLKAGTRPTNAKGDLIAVAKATGNFTVFLKVVEAAGLTATLKQSGPFTIFTPTDATFAKLPPLFLSKLLMPENKARLAAIISYHIAPSKLTASDLTKADEVKTLGGAQIDVDSSADGKTIQINEAKILGNDFEASNGILHAIDTVLSPDPCNLSFFSLSSFFPHCLPTQAML